MTASFGRMVGKRRAFYPVVAGIVLYTLLVGADASVMRAAIMGLLVALANCMNRRSLAIVSLGGVQREASGGSAATAGGGVCRKRRPFPRPGGGVEGAWKAQVGAAGWHRTDLEGTVSFASDGERFVVTK